MGAEPEVIPDAISYLQIYLLSLPFRPGPIPSPLSCGAMGDTRTPLILNTSANLLNVVLTSSSSTPPARGRCSASTSPSPAPAGVLREPPSPPGIATAVTGLGITWTALFGKKEYKVSLRDGLKPDRQIISRALELGIPTALEHATVSAGQIVITRNQRFSWHHRAGCGTRRRHCGRFKLYAGRWHLLCRDRPGWPVLWCQRI